MRDETKKKLQSLAPTYNDLHTTIKNYRSNNPKLGKIREFAIFDNCLEGIFQTYAAIYRKLKDEKDAINMNIDKEVALLNQGLEYFSCLVQDIQSCSDKAIEAIQPIFTTALNMRDFADASIGEFNSIAREIKVGAMENNMAKILENDETIKLTNDLKKNIVDFEVFKKNHPELMSTPDTNQLVENLNNMYHICGQVMVNWNNGIAPKREILNDYWQMANEHMSYDLIGNGI